jgi:hypothetical protein
VCQKTVLEDAIMKKKLTVDAIVEIFGLLQQKKF